MKSNLGKIVYIIGEYNKQEFYITGVTTNEIVTAVSNELQNNSYYLFDLEEDSDYNRYRDIWDLCVGDRKGDYVDYLPHFKAKNLINGEYYLLNDLH